MSTKVLLIISLLSLISLTVSLTMKSMKMGLVDNYKMLSKILLLQGQVTTGYGRGSKKLGVPTANLPHFDNLLQINKYERGVYFGWGCIENEPNKIYGCVANIGISPTFQGQENAINIVEAHLLDRNNNDNNNNNDFYDKNLRLALVSFLRPEQKFPSFDALITQINNDVNLARNLKDSINHNNNNDINLMKAYNIAKDFLMTSFENNQLSNKYQNSIIVNTNHDSQAYWCMNQL